MAFITKHDITIDTTHNNSATGIYFYSDLSPNGIVRGVKYVQSTANAVPSTATLSLCAGSTQQPIVTSITASTSFMLFPQAVVIASTGTLATTSLPIGFIPLAGDQLLRLALAGGTSAATTGLVSVYVEGN